MYLCENQYITSHMIIKAALEIIETIHRINFILSCITTAFKYIPLQEKRDKLPSRDINLINNNLERSYMFTKYIKFHITF